MDRNEYYEHRKEWFASNNKMCKVKYSSDGKEITELFTDDWTAVEVLRQRMKNLGKEERWIDIHWEIFKGFADECNKEEHEVVDYLYFCRVRYDETLDDGEQEYDEERFFLEIVDKPL